MFEIGGRAYAHRGLWDGGKPENSLAAFSAAAAAGVGAELDVHATRDGRLAVFHDATLQRMCNVSRRVADLDLAELQQFPLPDNTHIPSLEEALEALAGQPALIELKILGDGADLADRVAAFLKATKAPAAAMSFHEPTVSRLRALVSDRPVGLLIDPESRIGRETVLAKVKKAKGVGCDFIGPNIASLPTVAGAESGLPLACWTVRTEAELKTVKALGAAPIFERISPAQAAVR
jgi:glycerophosphoryl diester phosphodiesterase